MISHELKTLPQYFGQTWEYLKLFECRSTADRNFEVGDKVRLREWSEETGYTGREIVVKITSIITSGKFGIAPGFCVFGTKILEKVEK